MKKFIIMIGVLILIGGNNVIAGGCEPSGGVVPCESDSNSNSISNAESSSTGVGVGIGFAGANSQLDSDVIIDNTDNTVTDINARGGSAYIEQGDDIVTIKEGDTELITGDVSTDIGDVQATGGESYTGDNINNISNKYIHKTGYKIPNAPKTYEKIGDVERSTPSLMLYGGTEKDPYFSNKYSTRAGVNLVIPLGSKTTKYALQAAKFKIDAEKNYIITENMYLKAKNDRLQEEHDQEMRQEREYHQAQMVGLCAKIHKDFQKGKGDSSDDLWEMCLGFEHFNNKITNDRLGRHNQETDGKPNPRQFMPSSKGYRSQ